jgi:hypothetical protein
MPTKTKPKSLMLAPDPRVTALKARVTKLASAWKLSPGTLTTVTFEKAAQAVKDAVSIRKELKAILDPGIQEAKAELKAREKVFKDIDSILKTVESNLRNPLEDYAARQRALQEKQIESAMSKGKDEKAAVIAAKPFVPEVQGLSFTEHWHAEVENLHEFIVWVLSGPTAELENLLSPNLVTLNTLARAQKDALAIPGVKAVKETSSTIRG